MVFKIDFWTWGVLHDGREEGYGYAERLGRSDNSVSDVLKWVRVGWWQE